MLRPNEYDGIYFFPDSEGTELNLAYFTFTDDEKSNVTETYQNGDMFHIAFFKHMPNGKPKFDESFEAILADPSVYINNLIGTNLYGCIVRKTDKSSTWFSKYIDEMKLLIDKIVS